MTRRPKHPVGLRLRERADGTLRCWWEPNAAARKAGFTKSVELDAERMTWSHREAERLNREVAAVQAGKPLPARGATGRTIEDLIETYMRSRRFAGLAEATKADYRGKFSLIRKKWGSRLVADFSKPVVNAWYETLIEHAGAHQALSLVRGLSLLFSHAEIIGWRPEGSNPCARLGLKTPPPRKRVLTWAEIDALVAAAEGLGFHAMATAILLSVLEGQRQADVIAARRDAFDFVTVPGDEAPSWVWSFTRSKRGNEGVLPVHPDLVERIAAARTRPAPGDALLVDDVTGRAFSASLFRHRFAAVREAAAKAVPSVDDVQFRDLRRTFGALARAAGASREDVGDVLGNSAATDPRLGETYMPPSYHTSRRAVLSIRRPAADDDRRKA